MLKNQILYTALVTPFNKDGSEIDYSSLEILLRNQEESQNGVLLLGSTGESLSLSNNERKKIIEFACNLNLRNQIMVGVPSYNFNEALEWIKFCNDLPISGYLMTTPIYTKPGIIGQTEWFKRLLDISNYPAVLYNIPSRSAVKLHKEVVKNLSYHHNFVSIKDSGGLIDDMIEYQIVAPNISIYCGDDYLVNGMINDGAIGLISVGSNAWPKQARKFLEGIINKNTTTDQNRAWWQASKSLFVASNPIPIKYLLKEIGVIKNNTVRLPLSIEDIRIGEELILSYRKILSVFE